MDNTAPNYDKITYGAVDVCFLPELIGGGQRFGQDYISFIGDNLGRVGRVFEWCAGPGFIGFSLFAHGLCESLCLADINPAAVSACHETIRRNGIAEHVTVYKSDCLDDIPNTESWDLVVGNPPHLGTNDVHPEWGAPLIYMDVDWTVHRRFYATVKNHLRPTASVVIQEKSTLSTIETFQAMIENGGLKIRGTYSCKFDPRFYYVWSTP